jgi:hypothetical protein
MSMFRSTHAARAVVIALLSICHIGMVSAGQEAAPSYDRVGASEPVTRHDAGAARQPLLAQEAATPRAGAEAGQRMEARKGELARRMFWILLSLR